MTAVGNAVRIAVAVVIGMAIGVVSGCATAHRPESAEAATIDRLLELIAERLDVASDVARTKWNTGAPIEDLLRERQVIEGAASRAADYGLAREPAEDFFRAQIEASKVIQRSMHAEWTANRQPPFTTVADLERDIRPHLDRLTPEMLRALAAAVPVLTQPGGRQLLESRSPDLVIRTSGSRAAVTEAIAPLVRLASGTSRSRGTPPAVGIESCSCQTGSTSAKSAELRPAA